MSHLLEPLMAESPNRVLFTDKTRRVYRDDFTSDVWKLASTLVKLIEPGDRVALLGRTSLVWTQVDHAILAAGGVSVPVYETSSSSQIEWILSDSGAKLIVVETPAHKKLVRSVNSDITVWVMEDGDVVRVANTPLDDEVDRRINQLNDDNLASLVYTSGTTGRPKGCMLTHGNFRAASGGIKRAAPEVVHENACTVMFLPLAHVFGRAITFASIETGVVTEFCPDPKDMIETVGRVRPTFMVGVPRVLEKVLSGARANATGKKAVIFEKAYNTAVSYSSSERPSLNLKLGHALMDQLVYKKLRAKLGGELQYFISGGAALSVEVNHFFRGCGIEVLEGYGLTETSAPVSVVRPGRGSEDVGTVGELLDVSTVRVRDGELEFEGTNVFAGYWNQEVRGSWFASGDLGTFENGRLTITGRKKEIIVTAGGKNIAPGPLEEIIKRHPLVSQAMVLGDSRSFVAALLTLDEETLPAWAANMGLSVSAARGNSSLKLELEGAVKLANDSVSAAEAIKKFEIVEDFTEENGLLTPTSKVKRALVLEKHHDTVEKLYAR